MEGGTRDKYAYFAKKLRDIKRGGKTRRLKYVDFVLRMPAFSSR